MGAEVDLTVDGRRLFRHQSLTGIKIGLQFGIAMQQHVKTHAAVQDGLRQVELIHQRLGYGRK